MDHLTRQLEILPVDKLALPINIVGAGATGGFAALALAKMGFEDITVWDFDVVSIENMSCQFYRFKDIGCLKAQALAQLVEDFTKVIIKTHCRRFEERDVATLSGVVILAVDDMKARADIFRDITEGAMNVKWVIDPRMSAEKYNQFTINPHDPKDQKTYRKSLYTNEEAVAERCTAKSTMYTAMMASGFIAKTVKDLAVGAEYTRILMWNVASASSPLTAYGRDWSPSL